MPTAEPVIAILDDEPQMRTALRRLLTCRGFRVEEYEGAQDFLAVLGTRPLDCLLLDLHMPGLNGFDVLEALRARASAVPVIVVTAHDEPGTADRARSLGAASYLRKPVGRDSLLAAIKAATPATATADESSAAARTEFNPGDRACSPNRKPSPPSSDE